MSERRIPISQRDYARGLAAATGMDLAEAQRLVVTEAAKVRQANATPPEVLARIAQGEAARIDSLRGAVAEIRRQNPHIDLAQAQQLAVRQRAGAAPAPVAAPAVVTHTAPPAASVNPPLQDAMRVMRQAEAEAQAKLRGSGNPSPPNGRRSFADTGSESRVYFGPIMPLRGSGGGAR